MIWQTLDTIKKYVFCVLSVNPAGRNDVVEKAKQMLTDPKGKRGSCARYNLVSQEDVEAADMRDAF